MMMTTAARRRSTRWAAPFSAAAGAAVLLRCRWGSTGLGGLQGAGVGWAVEGGAALAALSSGARKSGSFHGWEHRPRKRPAD